MDARFVGIDVSKDKLDVHIRPGGETFVVARDADGLDELIKWLKPMRAVAIGVEATSGFEQLVMERGVQLLSRPSAVDCVLTIEDLAARTKHDRSFVRRTLKLSFLAPVQPQPAGPPPQPSPPMINCPYDETTSAHCQSQGLRSRMLQCL